MNHTRTPYSHGAATRVGPVLLANETGWAIVAAITKSNPHMEVSNRGSYLRILVPMRCVITRLAIEYELGMPFRFPMDLEAIMPAFAGHLTLTDHDAVWSAINHDARYSDSPIEKRDNHAG